MTGNQPLYRAKLGEVVENFRHIIFYAFAGTTERSAMQDPENITYKPSSFAISAKMTGVD